MDFLPNRNKWIVSLFYLSLRTIWIVGYNGTYLTNDFAHISFPLLQNYMYTNCFACHWNPIICVYCTMNFAMRPILIIVLCFFCFSMFANCACKIMSYFYTQPNDFASRNAEECPLKCLVMCEKISIIMIITKCHSCVHVFAKTCLFTLLYIMNHL